MSKEVLTGVQNFVDNLNYSKTTGENFLNRVRKREIEGINVTIPFKNSVIKHLDVLKGDALKTSSVNTVYLNKKKLIGDNTDVYGFSSGVLRKIKTRIKACQDIFISAKNILIIDF